MTVNSKTTFVCELCEREVPPGRRMKHHLVPKHKGGNKGPTIAVCGACGSQIHKLFTNKELAVKYNTLAALKATPEIRKWISWISKTSKFKVNMACKKRR